MPAVAEPCSPETATLPEVEIKVGDSVLGHFHDGSWYGASIVELKGDKFVVAWDDGDEEDTLKSRNQIRPKGQKDQGGARENAAPSPEPNQALSAPEAQTRGQDPAQGPATPPKDFPGSAKQVKEWGSASSKQASSKPTSTPQDAPKLSTPEQELSAANSVSSSLASSADTTGSPPQPVAASEPAPASSEVSSASEPKTPAAQPSRPEGGQGGRNKLERWLNRTAKQAKQPPPPSSAEKGVQQTPPPPSPVRSPRALTPSAQNTTKLDRWLQRTSHSRSPRHSPRNVEAMGGGGGGGGGGAGSERKPSANASPRSPFVVVRDARGTSKLDRWLSRTAGARARNAAKANGVGSGPPANASSSMQPAPSARPAQASPSPSPSSKIDRWLSRSSASNSGSGGAGSGSAVVVLDGREQAALRGVPGAGAGGVGVGMGMERGCEAMRAWMLRAGRRELGASSLPPFTQDDRNGYHRKTNEEGMYCGWLKAGLRHGLGSMRWSDGSEFHGDFEKGQLHGGGKFVFADGAVYTGRFELGKPVGAGFLVDRLGVRYKVELDSRASMREQQLKQMEPLTAVEEPHEPYVAGRCYQVALTVGAPAPLADGVYQGNFPNIKDVSARLVLARPPHADCPLWNAADVKGKLVAIMRGPRPPAPACAYGIKLFHAQNAGAVGVVFVDYDPEGGFTSMPRIDEIVIPGTEPPQRVQARIPTGYILYRDLGVIQEGAVHVLAFAPKEHPHNKRGWRTGALVCPPQESKVGLSKTKADALMAEFFNARKQERQQEEQLLVQKAGRSEEEKERELLSKEWVTGALFDSLNPLKQVKETDGTDAKVAQSMVKKMEKLAGEDNVKFFRSLFTPAAPPSPETQPQPAQAQAQPAQGQAQPAQGQGQPAQGQGQPAQGQQQKPEPPPLPPPPPQGEETGYHVVVEPESHTVFSGFLHEGVPHGRCSLRWRDGSELHAAFHLGVLEGKGRYIYADRSEFRGEFKAGCPTSGFYLDVLGARHKVEYDGRKALWEAGCEAMCMEEEPPTPYEEGRAETVAMTKCQAGLRPAGDDKDKDKDKDNKDKEGANNAAANGSVQVVPDYSHIRNVSGRLVWARPQYADMPLWNADEVRGKLVAIVRGPRAPAPAVSYSKKLYYAQEAGAIGVVLVDVDPRGRFGVLPRLEQGPIAPGGPVLDTRIPAAFVLHRHAHFLQEGALHHMVFAPPGHPAAPPGWRIGFVMCPRQESKVGLSKTKADALMAEFFNARKQERQQEDAMLKEKKANKAVCGVDAPEELSGREWVSGHIFDSLNPLKQAADASRQQGPSMTAAMLSKVTSKQRAEEISESLDKSAAMLHGLVQGALATMTGEAMHNNVLSGFGGTAASPSPPAHLPSSATTPSCATPTLGGAAVDRGEVYDGKRDMGIQVDPPTPPDSPPRPASILQSLGTTWFSSPASSSPSRRAPNSPRRV